MKQKWLVIGAVAAIVLGATIVLAVMAADRWSPAQPGVVGVGAANAALWREYLALLEEHLRAQGPGWAPSREEHAGWEVRERVRAEKTVQAVMARRGIDETEALEGLIQKERRIIAEFRTNTATQEAIRKHEQEKHSDNLDPYGQKKRPDLPDRPDNRPRPYW